MAGKSVSPVKIAEAVTLRAAGYTATAIADRLGVSVRTLHRAFEHHKTRKGEVTDELIQAAKRDLLQAVISTDRIKQEAACLVTDDLAHARLLRSRMADATEHMTATNLEEAALLMRAAAAYSTALTNTSHMLRLSLGTKRALETVEAQELPVLILSEISDEDALRMTKANQELMTSIGEGESPGAVLKGAGTTIDDDRVEDELDVACS